MSWRERCPPLLGQILALYSLPGAANAVAGLWITFDELARMRRPA